MADLYTQGTLAVTRALSDALAFGGRGHRR